MIERRSIETQDIDQLAESMSGWSQEYDQIQPGQFQGKLTELWIGDVQICRETTRSGLIERGSVRDDALYAVVPLGSNGEGSINGEVLGDSDVFCGSGGHEWFTKTADEWDLLLFIIPRDTIAASLEAAPTKFITSPAGHRIKNAGSAPYMDRLKSTAKVMFDFQDTSVPSEVVSFFQASLHENIANLFNQIRSDDDTVSGNLEDMMRVLRGARELIEHDDNPVVQVDEIAKALGVSRRTFQNYCQTITGTPPTAFLRALRLNNARRLLTATTPEDQVLDAAFKSHFAHGGRFSKYYYELFGERPSDTRVADR